MVGHVDGHKYSAMMTNDEWHLKNGAGNSPVSVDLPLGETTGVNGFLVEVDQAVGLLVTMTHGADLLVEDLVEDHPEEDLEEALLAEETILAAARSTGAVLDLRVAHRRLSEAQAEAQVVTQIRLTEAKADTTGMPE